MDNRRPTLPTARATKPKVTRPSRHIRRVMHKVLNNLPLTRHERRTYRYLNGIRPNPPFASRGFQTKRRLTNKPTQTPTP